MSAPETHLEQAERHIREIEDRIAQQEALVAELEGQNFATGLTQARAILATFRETLVVAKEHRRILLEEEKTRRRGAT